MSNTEEQFKKALKDHRRAQSREALLIGSGVVAFALVCLVVAVVTAY